MQKKAAKEAETFGNKVYKIASHIPGVNKLAKAFVDAKQKITETVKESKTVKTIGTAVDGARQKVEAFKNAHPAVQKVADAFGKAKAAAGDLAGKMPSVTQVVQAAGSSCYRSEGRLVSADNNSRRHDQGFYGIFSSSSNRHGGDYKRSRGKLRRL